MTHAAPAWVESVAGSWSERCADPLRPPIAEPAGGREASMGTLYVVATPIGNLEDVTLRALRVLSEVGLIAAEDTRVTRKLLSRHGVRTPLVSFREHTTPARRAALVARLADADMALVSDAGTPGV
jgi:16S rRNA C1402 (ribose-2'-O) methylase RsmI